MNQETCHRIDRKANTDFSGSGGKPRKKTAACLEDQGELSGPERGHDPLCSQRDIMDQVLDVPKIRNQN